MPFDLTKITKRVLTAVFNLGGPIVKDASFYRPPTFQSATGEMISSEVVAACKFVGGSILSVHYLGFAPVVPGTETLLIRASELAAVVSPGKGDYIVETASGLRRNVEGARLDPSSQFYSFQCVRSLDQDWGDLTAQTISEDWGDLTAVTSFDDWMALT